MKYVQPSSDAVAQAMLGRGAVPVYSGSLGQAGYGFGGVVKFIKSELKPMLMNMARGHGKTVISNVAKDMFLRFKNPESSFKYHAKKEGKRFLGNVMNELAKQAWGKRVGGNTPYTRHTRTKRVSNRKTARGSAAATVGKRVGARSKRTRHLDQVGGVNAGTLMRGAFRGLFAVPHLLALAR